MKTYNSSNSPIRIDTVAIPGQAGTIGITLCPGKQGDSSWGDIRWERDLQVDLRAISAWGPDVWVNLMEPAEMRQWRVGELSELAGSVCQYFNLPIVDGRAPDQAFDAAWVRVGAVVRQSLKAGKKVLIQCRGGMGRAGTVASRLLIEFGMAPERAIKSVKAAREGAVETAAQVAYLRGLRVQLGTSDAGINTAERIRGGLLGLLVGDALGVPYEFKPASRIPPRHEIEMNPPPACPSSYPRVPAGTWSDDGAQALCLIETLTRSGTLDLDDFAQRLLNWQANGYMAVDGIVFDIGNQTSRALGRLKRGVPALAAGAGSSDSCGNGSLMRVLGLALWHQGSVKELFDLARRQSMVTHGHPQAQLCCALYCGVAHHLMAGVNAEAALEQAIAELIRYCADDLDLARELQMGVLNSVYRARPTGSGYVVDTLWSALACLQQADYEAAVRSAIALGSDTDTTAAVAGGLAGILHGTRSIPTRWMNALRGREIADPVLQALEMSIERPAAPAVTSAEPTRSVTPPSAVGPATASLASRSPIARAISRISLGACQRYQNLSVLPLISKSDSSPAYVLLDQALKLGTAQVTEISEAGSVPELAFENLGDTPILLIDGEELRGARQNRILNVSILVGARKRIVIPVSCVERGRWAYQQRHFNGSDQMLFGSARRSKAQAVTESLRSRGVATADQQQIWRSIDERFESSRGESKTAAMSDLYDAERGRIEDYQRAFSWMPGQAGAAFAIDGVPVAVEMFDSASVFRLFLRKTVSSFALDALACERGKDTKPALSAFEHFIERVAAAPVEPFRAVGEGRDLRLLGSGVSGGALEFDGRLLHLNSFGLPVA